MKNTQQWESIWPSVPGPWKLQPVQIGFINRTYRVTAPCGDSFLRIYQNIRVTEHIELELAMMDRLQAEDLSFAVPAAVPTQTGEQVASVPLEEGREALAMLLPVIPGHHPEADHEQHAYAAGAALGELDAVLQTWGRPQELFVSTPAYGEFDKIHPLVPDPLTLAATLPVSEEERVRIQRLIAETMEVTPQLYRHLPQQVIHGDFTRGNTLVLGDRVTGVLDFEFSGYDLRALEFAVGLNEGPVNEMWGTGREWTWLTSFGRGYASRQTLSEEEITALPALMRLRVAYFVVHFAGRYREGIDSEQTMRGYVEWALIHEKWREGHAEELVRRAREWFGKA